MARPPAWHVDVDTRQHHFATTAAVASGLVVSRRHRVALQDQLHSVEVESQRIRPEKRVRDQAVDRNAELPAQDARQLLDRCTGKLLCDGSFSPLPRVTRSSTLSTLSALPKALGPSRACVQSM